MSLNIVRPKCLISNLSRPVSSFISKKRRQEINERKVRENRRASKIVPESEDELPTYVYAGTNRNPQSRVFAWGMACYGALGNPDILHPARKTQTPRKTLSRPGRISRLELHKIKDIACGYGYSVFASKSSEGHLFATGVNNLGQIGYHEEVAGHPLDTIIRPVPIKLPIKDAIDSVRRVECGQAHTLALTKAGKVFSLGSNAYGQCGRPVITDEDYFKSKVIHTVQVPIDANDEITDIECGINHSMFLTKLGQVFSCGWSADGQTGLGHYDNQENPARIQGDIKGETIIKVVCTADNVLALNDQGEVFGWGNSEYAQFNMVSKEQQICSPVKLDLGQVGKVIDIATGGSICLVLNGNSFSSKTSFFGSKMFQFQTNMMSGFGGMEF